MTFPDHLIIDDVPRPTTNSLGRPIHPTEEGIRNFWAWFGASKCVDADGRPLVVFHGTPHDLSAFRNNPIWFTREPGQSFSTGGAIYPAYLRIATPLTREGYFGMEDFSLPSKFKWFDKASGSWKTPDGIIGSNGVMVAFSPAQIKSALGNSGDFAPGNTSLTDHGSLSFKSIHRGHAHGQDDYTLRAYKGTLAAGLIDYSVYQGVPSVQMIHVEPFSRRQGIATQLVLRLQSEHPESQIEFGGLTEAGKAFYDSLPKTTLPTPQAMLFEARKSAQEAAKSLLAKARALDPEKSQPEATYTGLMDALNDLNDQIADLDRELVYAQPEMILIRHETPAPVQHTEPGLSL